MVQFYLALGSPKNIDRRPRRVILPSTSAPCGKEQWQVFSISGKSSWNSSTRIKVHVDVLNTSTAEAFKMLLSVGRYSE